MYPIINSAKQSDTGTENEQNARPKSTRIHAHKWQASSRSENDNTA